MEHNPYKAPNSSQPQQVEATNTTNGLRPVHHVLIAIFIGIVMTAGPLCHLIHTTSLSFIV